MKITAGCSNKVVTISTRIVTVTVTSVPVNHMGGRSQSTCNIYLFSARSLKILNIDSNPDILNCVQFWLSDRTRGLEQGTPITAREVL
jgi:hypothetical protein